MKTGTMYKQDKQNGQKTTDSKFPKAKYVVYISVKEPN